MYNPFAFNEEPFYYRMMSQESLLAYISQNFVQTE